MSVLEAPSGNVIIANPQMWELFGLDPSVEFNAELFDKLQIFDHQGLPFPKEDWDIWKVLSTGRTMMREIEIVRPNGQRRFVSSTNMAVRDSAGAIVAAVVILIDNTDQVKARAALMQSEHRFRDLADALPQIVWTADASGAVDYYNQQWNNYFGITVDGSPVSWARVIHPDDFERAEERWQQCLATGQVYNMSYRLRGDDGQ